MHTSESDPKNQSSLPENGHGDEDNRKTSEQQQSDPPLTEIKGVTEPENYEEPEVEDESEDKLTRQ